MEGRAIIKKRLLLILPRTERGYWGKVRHGKAGLVRLSLPTVAALTPPDWEVTIHDARVDPVDYGRPVDLVGITAFTSEILSAYAIADEFRARGVPVVLGGIHASALPNEALAHADAVVVGEAEGVWAGLLEDLAAGRLQRIYRAPAPCDMKAMPVPRRDLMRREMYTSFNTVQATRGCPYDCDYCAVTGVFGKQFRTRPVDEVLAEIQAFDTRRFFFADDNICGHPVYAKQLFAALIPLRRIWGGQTSITFARDAELLRLYARSGGRYAFIGLETISKDNLAAINKKWNRRDGYGEAIRRIHDAGINIVASFIFGLDGDDPTVFARTLDFVMEHRIDAAQFHILTPFPGTRLFDAFEAEGRIVEKRWDRYHTGEVVFTPRLMTADQLQDGYHWIFRQTYTIPNILKRVLRGWRPRDLRGIPVRVAMNISYRNKALKMPLIPCPSPVLMAAVASGSPTAP
ncbi:MAG: B12-binding domain-containing radical SAM protein [bacterium]|nr:B12-binding domain-containing radical SAM protein [bacterium]